LVSVPAIFRALNRARVRYLLLGGYASIVHGVPRTTLDVDVVLDPEPGNVRRALAALRRLRLEPETDRVEEVLAQGGVTARNDREVDLLTALPVGSFADLWPRRIVVAFRGSRIPVVSRPDQIRLLRASGRPQDMEDADVLERLDRDD
jgi:hypothetical protein